MSSPPFAPGIRPRPAVAARTPVPKRLPWTWLERFLVAQSFIPALLFVPGISSGRVVIRMATFFLALGVWFAVVQSGRAGPSSSFSPTTWLKLAVGWLILSIFHWNTTSIPAGVAQATLYIAVFSPAFWAPKVLSSPRQLNRLMTILLICNGVSSVVGLGQVFRPGTFNPPVIPGITGVPEELDDGVGPGLQGPVRPEDHPTLRAGRLPGGAAGGGRCDGPGRPGPRAAADPHVQTAGLPGDGLLRHGGDLLLAGADDLPDGAHLPGRARGYLRASEEFRLRDAARRPRRRDGRGGIVLGHGDVGHGRRRAVPRAGTDVAQRVLRPIRAAPRTSDTRWGR